MRISGVAERVVVLKAELGAPEPPAVMPSLELDFAVELPSVSRRSRSVLVVDDDSGFRQALRELLEDEGLTVVGEAENGLDAVRLAKELRPAVVLMDMRMPSLGGIEATRLIKQDASWTQVIVLSAYDDPALQRAAQDVEVYCYLVKGCPPDLITQMVGRACEFGTGLAREQPDPSI